MGNISDFNINSKVLSLNFDKNKHKIDITWNLSLYSDPSNFNFCLDIKRDCDDLKENEWKSQTINHISTKKQQKTSIDINENGLYFFRIKTLSNKNNKIQNISNIKSILIQNMITNIDYLDPKTKDNEVSINNNCAESTKDGRNNIFGFISYSSPQQKQWKIKIKKTGGYMAIGIIVANKAKKMNNVWIGAKKYGYVYHSNGYKYNGKYEAYGAAFKTDDVIDVSLSKIDGIYSVSFLTNSKLQGIAFKLNENEKYKLAISFDSKNDEMYVLCVLSI